MLYAIDKWGRVHFGRNPAEVFKKVREAEGDSISSGLDGVYGVLEVEAGLKLREIKQRKKKKIK